MRRFAERHGSSDPNLLLGLDAPDDAAVYRISDDLALIQTADFFTPIVDDPYDWGAIAAANAFSDVYAMGGQPMIALNLVGWPKDGLSFDLLSLVLDGAADKATEAGVSVIGGHTIDDPEPKFGMAVTGKAHPEAIVRSSAAKPGMDLVLTKPLGSGIIATAIKKQAALPDLIDRVTMTMSKLNDGAARAMLESGAAAATDITGFGFLGHLHDLCMLSGVSAVVHFDEVPFIPGVAELARAGNVPGGTLRNAEYFGQFVEFSGLEDTGRLMLFDAQTSGGLLIAVEQSRTAKLVSLLESEQTLAWAVVGQTTEGATAGKIVVKGPA